MIIFQFSLNQISVIPGLQHPLPIHCHSHSPISVQERSTSAENKITVNDENGTPLATSSFQANS
jgi:hypothetical protein